jgi:hypothetical protein
MKIGSKNRMVRSHRLLSLVLDSPGQQLVVGFLWVSTFSRGSPCKQNTGVARGFSDVYGKL